MITVSSQESDKRASVTIHLDEGGTVIPSLQVPVVDWVSFVAAIKAGNFDDVLNRPGIVVGHPLSGSRLG
jgi:hypothetical protein